MDKALWRLNQTLLSMESLSFLFGSVPGGFQHNIKEHFTTMLFFFFGRELIKLIDNLINVYAFILHCEKLLRFFIIRWYYKNNYKFINLREMPLIFDFLFCFVYLVSLFFFCRRQALFNMYGHFAY